jgi:hypothetical protein
MEVVYMRTSNYMIVPVEVVATEELLESKMKRKTTAALPTA